MQSWIYQPSNSLLMLGDFNASYYVFPYEVDPDIEIVIKGQFPYARYMSFSVTGIIDTIIVNVPDRKLIPDPGSVNPFLPGANWNADYRNYTLKIVFSAPPYGTEFFVPEAGNNIVYAGILPNGLPNQFGFIGLRIYVPSLGYDRTGGVGLPKITYCAAKGERRQKNTVETNDQTNFLQTQQNQRNQKNVFDTNTLYKRFKGNCDLTWSRIGVIATRILQPDINTIYIVSDRIQRDPGKLLYIRWKAPTFPDTYHNIGILGNENIRYWSMSFISRAALLGLYTLGDFQTVIDEKGYVNLVISFGAQRPSCVTTENGFNWVDVSHLPLVPLYLFYRNNQVAQDFPYSARNIPEGQIVPPEVMGKYYPCGKYVDPLYFKSCGCDCDDKDDWRENHC